MVENNLPNFSFSFKKIKKLALSLSCMTLLACSVQASNNLNDLADYVKSVVTQNIVEPFTDAAHDLEEYVERALRLNSSNWIDQQLQNYFDFMENILDKINKDLNN